MKADVTVTVRRCLGAGSLLGFDGSLLAHGSEDDNVGILLLGSEELINLLANFSIGNLHIILGLTIVSHQGKETIIRDIEKLVFLAGNVGNIHVVGGWAKFFELLASENIDGDEMNFSVTVLASLGSGHIDDLAGAILDANKTVLP